MHILISLTVLMSSFCCRKRIFKDLSRFLFANFLVATCSSVLYYLFRALVSKKLKVYEVATDRDTF